MNTSKTSASFASSFARRCYSLILLLIGIVLCWIGIELLLVGGSAYYIIAALLVLWSAVLNWRGDARAALVYGAMFAGTLVWAVWEVGLDGWALMPRLVGPAVMGLYFLGPWCGGTRKRITVPAAAIGVLLVAFVAKTVVSPMADTAAIAASPIAREDVSNGEWPVWGGNQGGQRFSPLRQITPENVGKLKLLWTYRTGAPTSPFEATPLKIGNRLFLCTPDSDVIALDSDTGAQRWRFRARADSREVAFKACRGVAYHKDRAALPDQPCAERIVSPSIDARLFAVDAATGAPCPGFGVNGAIDLRDGLGPVEKGYYFVSSAPLVMHDKIVVGGFIPDNQHLGQPSGVIRAFDAISGKLVWAFDVGRPGNRAQPPAGDRFTPDTPNSWGPMSGDEALGLVYIPTGNATPDWYGGQRRPFDDKYSSSVVALDIDSGAPRWSFQTTHHDLWDYDVASQPTLYDIPVGNTRVPALVQPTKRGEIFVLDRRTGRPITAVEERRVPQSDVRGERSSPTQPFSVGMPSFSGPQLTERMMWGLTPIDQAWCRLQFRRARNLGPMTPPALGRYTIISPGYMGGSNWGTVSIDPTRHILVGNSNRMAMRSMLMTRAEADRKGVVPMGRKGHVGSGSILAQAGTPYALYLEPFLSPLGIPCQQPPYGLISAIDMKTRKLLWSKAFGTARDSGPLGIPSQLPFTMGVPNTGGSVLTGSGLAFIAATQERAFRALDIRTGREVWKVRLPAGGQATPMTYLSSDGRQIVLIAAGGNGILQSKPGDFVLAYALAQ